MTVKDLKHILKKLEKNYTKEQIDNLVIGYEIIEDGDFAVAKAILGETSVSEVEFPDDDEPILTLVFSEFEEDNDTTDRVLGMPINLN